MRHPEAIPGKGEEKPENFDFFPNLDLQLAQLALANRHRGEQTTERRIVTDTVIHHSTTTPVMSGKFVANIVPDPNLL